MLPPQNDDTVQDAPDASGGSLRITEPGGQVVVAESACDDWSAGHAIRSALAVMGAPVRDVNDREIGEVADLMLDGERGRVVYLVVEVGAVLGIGGEHFALPWPVVAGVEPEGVRLSVDVERVRAAPPVELEFWPGMAGDARWARAVHEHFGATPYWVAPKR